MTSGRITALVLSEDDGLAARIEATLRQDPRLRVRVGSVRAMARLVEDHDPAVIVLAATAARAASTLAARLDASHAPPLVLLVDDPRAAWTSAARRAGVRAVLPREATAEEITAAVAGAATGLIVLHPETFAPVGAVSGEGGEERTLTPRELEILEMMAEGLSNETIGRRLAISAYTVKFHVASILAKLGAGSRTEAVTLGVRRGLISL
jgi:NarL family two-component system response regulator YdfI